MFPHFYVLPFDPQDQDLLAQLQQAGITPPDEKGRCPTLGEVLELLQHNKNLVVQPADRQGVTVIDLNLPDDLADALILGKTDREGLFHLYFQGWQSDPMRMLTIVKRLSAFCGPLVLQAQDGGSPILIALDTDVEAAFQDWDQRRLDRS